ncbi:phage/plasmid primase, P4 family [Weissella viridescens]|uniref:phage/plasmid primase, P4 family n=1 Tax=Weissella viridescens TaxID=1629 RepID=UPI002575A8F4|nr:phage/plasmid primase, P4 family [Weissella viridescens]WJI90841.1 phage/plasmid primase, P4 family [Weissella viridescens]
MTEEKLSELVSNADVINHSETPNWLAYNDNGTPSINYTKLATQIADLDILFYNENNPNGAYFNGVFWVRYGNSRQLPVKLKALVFDELNKYGLSTFNRVKYGVAELQNVLASKYANIIDPFIVTERTKWLVPFKNGTVSTKDLSFKPNDANDMLTSGITNYEYPIDDQDTPIFNDYMNYVFGDSAIAALEGIGYSFYRSYDALGQPIYYIVSSGGNGKSWFANKVLIPLLGGNNNVATLSLTQIASKNKGNKFALAPLQDKLINVYMDNTTEAFIDISTLKSITGDDIQDAENKGQDSFQLRSYATQWLASNDFPQLPVGDSTIRRLRFLPWQIKTVLGGDQVLEMERRFPLDQLEKELPYIAKQAIQAFHNAFQRGTLTHTQAMTDLTNEFVQKNDMLRSFINENTKTTTNPYEMITFQNFYANYSQYVDELKQEPETTKDVKKRMTKSLGYTMERSQKGLGLSDQSDQDNQGRFKNVIQGMTWLEEKD